MKSDIRHNLGSIYLPGLLVAVLIASALFLLNLKVNSLRDQHYAQVAMEMNAQVDRLIEAKRKSTLALTLALADNANIKDVLLNNTLEEGMNEASKRLSSELRQNTKYKNVWFQLIDKEGISRSRSWVNKYGDQISKVRPDIRLMMQSPHVMETISTGKFTISFKSMVPIYHEQQFIGMVEVITHFNSIIKELEQAGIRSVVLVDKRYRKQLTKAVSKTFIDDYYVANFDIHSSDIKQITKLGVANLIRQSRPIIDGETLVTRYTIAGVNDEQMGYYIQIVPLGLIQNADINRFIRNLLIAVFLIIIAILLIAVLLYRNKKLAEREKLFFQSIIDSSGDLMLITDGEHIESANKAFFSLFSQLPDKRLNSLTPYIKDEKFLQRLQCNQGWSGLLHKLTDQETDLKFRINHQDFYFSLNIQPLQQNTRQFVLRLIDITERKENEEKLRFSANVFTHAREGIMITEEDGTIIDINDAFLTITGFERHEVLGENPRILSSGHHGTDFYAVLWQDILQKGYWTGEIWNKRKNGELFAEMLTISAVDDPGTHKRYFVALFSDITDQKKQQQQLEHLAHYDALTALPNRRHLSDLLHQAMAEAESDDKRLAVFYLDLDGFKEVNDNHSHEFGDKLLITLSHRMQSALGTNDIIGRIGGDEFVGVLVDLPDEIGYISIFNRLLQTVADPVYIDGYKLEVSASLGITFYPQGEGTDADNLLRQADQAMYQAKLAGKNRFHVFDAQHDRNVRGHHEAIESVRQALNAGQFTLHYQPKVNMSSGQVVGAEALIRWQHPEQGLLLPGHFLPTISNHPLSVDLGSWVIDQALLQVSQWQQQGIDLCISINIAPLQLQDPQFIHQLQEKLASYPTLRPGCIQFEVIETHALENLSGVVEVIGQCRKMGIDFALDDFGTGYSSLSYLKKLPAHTLKVDRSFVRDMLDDPEDLAILEATIGLARSFQREIIAEGVETEAQGLLLLQLGCHLAQGFLISRPLEAEKLPSWLSNWQPPESWQKQKALPTNFYPLLYMKAEHRAWVQQFSAFISGELRREPELKTLESFSQWHSEQPRLNRHYGNLAAMTTELLQEIRALSQQAKPDDSEDLRQLQLKKLQELSQALEKALNQLLTPEVKTQTISV